MYIHGGVNPGAKKDQYEVYIMRTQPAGSEKSRDWELLLGDVPSLEGAIRFKESLVAHRKFSEDDVAIQRVTWVAVTIGVVG